MTTRRCRRRYESFASRSRSKSRVESSKMAVIAWHQHADGNARLFQYYYTNQLAAITAAAAAADDDVDEDDDEDDDDFFFSTMSLILRLTFSLCSGGTDCRQNRLKASSSRSSSSISSSFSRSISLGVNTSVKDTL